MKFSIANTLKKYAQSFHVKEPQSKDNATDSSVSEGTLTSSGEIRKRSSKEKQKTKPKKKEAPLILTVEEIQASLRTLPKDTNTVLSVGVWDEVSIEDVQTRMKVVEEWIQCFNDHDLERTVPLMTDNAQFQFAEPKGTNLVMEFQWEDWKGMIQSIFASFTDFKFRYKRVRHVNGVIIVQGFQACGTHDGTPFGFGPFEPLPAEGKYVENDPEEVYFYFQPNNHKQLCRVTWYTMGDMTGPSGLYTQLGGFPLL